MEEEKQVYREVNFPEGNPPAQTEATALSSPDNNFSEEKAFYITIANFFFLFFAFHFMFFVFVVILAGVGIWFSWKSKKLYAIANIMEMLLAIVMLIQVLTQMPGE